MTNIARLIELFNDQYRQITREIESLHETRNNINSQIINLSNQIIQPTQQIPTTQQMPTTQPNPRTTQSNPLTNSASRFYLYTYPSQPLTNFFNSVPILPSQRQINNATRNLLYRDITNPLNTACPISLETFNSESSVTQIIYCNHIFNPTSLDTWFYSSCKCPVCRHDIRDITIHQETEEHEETKEEDTLEETKEDIPTLSSQIMQSVNDILLEQTEFDSSFNSLLYQTLFRNNYN